MYDILGQPNSGKNRKKESSPFSGSFDFGLSSPKKQVERDSRRAFSSRQRNEIWAQQNGKCAKCHNKLDPRTREYDHVKPWADKGKTIITNGAALCANCHKLKSHYDGLKKTDKKRKPKNEGYGFGVNPFGSPSKKSKNPWQI